MQSYKADLHTHTVLSPCGSLYMSPKSIIAKAKQKNISILGITDHNSTLMCETIANIAKDENILVLLGVEVNTSEEVHCLSFFPDLYSLNKFQEYIDKHLPHIKNNPEKFGYQVVVDKNENILREIDTLLISALDIGIEQIEKVTHQLNGLFIPAHINKSTNSIISQLGFIPGDLKFDALEISKHIKPSEYKKKLLYLGNPTLIQSSDAHYIDNIGDATTIFKIEELSFSEICLALQKKQGRKTITV